MSAIDAAIETQPITFSGDSRVAVPGLELAVSFPDGWRVETTPDYTDALLQADYVRAWESCYIGREMEARTVAEATQEMMDGLSLQPGHEDIVQRSVELPLGPASRIDGRRVAGNEWTTYLFSAGDAVVWLECAAHVAPGDRWLHIAETLERSTDAPSPNERFDPRVESPTLGFAIAFPEEWTVMGAAVRGARPRDDGDTVPVLWADGDGARCDVYDEWRDADVGAWTTIEDMQESYMTSLYSGPDARTTYLDLPAGRAARTDWSAPGDTDGVIGAVYSFTDGDSWWRLACDGTAPPEDSWLSIAETFRFLPVEE